MDTGLCEDGKLPKRVPFTLVPLIDKSNFKQAELNPTEQPNFHEDFDTVLMQYHGIN